MFISSEVLLKIALNDPTVTSVSWQGNGAHTFHQISKEELMQLGNALKNNTQVTSLFLSDAWFVHDAFVAFADLVFKNNVTLKKVSFIEMNLWGKQVHALIEALKKNPSVICLDVRRNPIGEEMAQCVIPLLQTNSMLEEVLLDEVYWNADGYGGSNQVVISQTTLSEIKRLQLHNKQPGSGMVSGLSIFSNRKDAGTQTELGCDRRPSV
jgi:hypothetical protein